MTMRNMERLVSVDSDGLRHITLDDRSHDGEKARLSAALRKSRQEMAALQSNNEYLASLYKAASLRPHDEPDKRIDQEISNSFTFTLPTSKDLRESKGSSISGCFSPRGRPYVPLGGTFEMRCADFEAVLQRKKEKQKVRDREKIAPHPGGFFRNQRQNTASATKGALLMARKNTATSGTQITNPFQPKSPKGKTITGSSKEAASKQEGSADPQDYTRLLAEVFSKGEEILLNKGRPISRPMPTEFPSLELKSADTKRVSIRSGTRSARSYLEEPDKLDHDLVPFLHTLTGHLDAEEEFDVTNELILANNPLQSNPKSSRHRSESLTSYRYENTNIDGDEEDEESVEGEASFSRFNQKSAAAIAARFVATRKRVDFVQKLSSKLVDMERHFIQSPQKPNLSPGGSRRGAVFSSSRRTTNGSRNSQSQEKEDDEPETSNAWSWAMQSFVHHSGVTDQQEQPEEEPGKKFVRRSPEELFDRTLRTWKAEFENVKKRLHDELGTELLRRRIDRIQTLKDDEAYGALAVETFQATISEVDYKSRARQSFEMAQQQKMQSNIEKITSPKTKLLLRNTPSSPTKNGGARFGNGNGATENSTINDKKRRNCLVLGKMDLLELQWKIQHIHKLVMSQRQKSTRRGKSQHSTATTSMSSARRSIWNSKKAGNITVEVASTNVKTLEREVSSLTKRSEGEDGLDENSQIERGSVYESALIYVYENLTENSAIDPSLHVYLNNLRIHTSKLQLSETKRAKLRRIEHKLDDKCLRSPPCKKLSEYLYSQAKPSVRK